MHTAKSISWVCAVIGAAGVAGTTAGQPVLVDDGFENYAVGALPGGPWADVTTRIDTPTVPKPSAVVISTTDAFGNPTQALQTVDAIGTSSGVLAAFKPTPVSRISADLRIDQFTDVRRGATWSAAVGFLQDTKADDFNSGPQAVIYAAVNTPTYRVFVLNGGQSFDFAIPGADVTLGSWVSVQLELDAGSGAVHASVSDPVTQKVFGEVSQTLAGWSAADAQFDAVAFFDGEYNTSGGTRGGQATLDNVVHTVIPAPSAAVVVIAGSLVLVNRRRMDSFTCSGQS